MVASAEAASARSVQAGDRRHAPCPGRQRRRPCTTLGPGLLEAPKGLPLQKVPHGGSGCSEMGAMGRGALRASLGRSPQVGGSGTHNPMGRGHACLSLLHGGATLLAAGAGNLEQ